MLPNFVYWDEDVMEARFMTRRLEKSMQFTKFLKSNIFNI